MHDLFVIFQSFFGGGGNPFGVDEHCDMELDETDPAVWMKLEAATDEYIENNSPSFKDVCEKLLQNQNDEKLFDHLKSQQFFKAKGSNADDSASSFVWRRNVLLVEASHSSDSGRVFHHAWSLETFCARNGIRLSLINGISGTYKAVP